MTAEPTSDFRQGEVVENAESTGLLLNGNNLELPQLNNDGQSLDDDTQARQEWHEHLLRWQSIACVISHVLSLLGALIVMWWVHLLGGLSWSPGHSKEVFNWHPLLMVLAFCFMTVAALSFRAPYKSSVRSTIKFVHVSQVSPFIEIAVRYVDTIY